MKDRLIGKPLATMQDTPRLWRGPFTLHRKCERHVGNSQWGAGEDELSRSLVRSPHIGFLLVLAERSSVQYCRSLISKWERQIKSGEKAVSPLGQPATNTWFWSNLERSGSCRNWFPKDHCEDFELSLTPSLWCLALKSQPYFAMHPGMPCAWGMTKWMALSYLCQLAEAI